MTVRRLAGQLIRVATRRLPDPDRAVRRREWAAEVAAILDDTGTGRVRRQIRAVLFAADHIRGARGMAGRAYFPVTGWRSNLPRLVPLYALAAATLATYWLPLTRPTRLALDDLLVAAVMAVQIIRERRHWLTGSTEEFGNGRQRRRSVLGTWWNVPWLILYIQVLRNMPGWYQLALLLGWIATFWMIRPAERWIFTRPGLPGDCGERDGTSPGTPPAA
jgi:hypothetical protein